MTFLLSFENTHACRINSRNRADTFNTKHFRGRRGNNAGRKYKVRIETAPDMTIEWGVFAGIQTPRKGGTTQMPCRVRTVITPTEANTSWCSGWKCSGITSGLENHGTHSQSPP